MAGPNSNTFTGARAVAYVISDGVPIPLGYCSGVSGGEQITWEPIDVIGLLEVREHVPVAYVATLNAQIFRTIGSSLKAQGVMSVQDDILTSGVMQFAIRDEGVGKFASTTKLQGSTIQLFEGVRCAGHTFDVTARGVVQEAVEFVAIRVTDELENL